MASVYSSSSPLDPMRTALLALPLALAAPLRRPKRATPAPVLAPRNAPPVEGKYVVSMKASAEATARATARAVSAIAAGADHTYSRSFNGFAASLTPHEVEALQGNPDVGAAGRASRANIDRAKSTTSSGTAS